MVGIDYSTLLPPPSTTLPLHPFPGTRKNETRKNHFGRLSLWVCQNEREILPKRKISQQELITFLTAINTELKKKLPVEKVSAAQKIITALKGDPEKSAITGVAAWYQNAPSDALLLLTYAASKSPDDNTLNNCGAIFNLCGLEDKAIPVLKYVLANQPDNSTVLNNIGQAYAGLGELDTAMHYLMACRGSESFTPRSLRYSSIYWSRKRKHCRSSKADEWGIKNRL